VTELVAYRCAAWETPLWFDPNPLEARYNRAGEAPTAYFGLHPLTPWAETLRGGERKTDGEILALRPPTWAVRVSLDPADVVELSFDEPGPLSAEDLVDGELTACQTSRPPYAQIREDPTPSSRRAQRCPAHAASSSSDRGCCLRTWRMRSTPSSTSPAR
jgi:hypothetical protein